VVSVTSTTRIQLDWTAPAGAAVAGYHVERAPVDVLSEDQLLGLKARTVPLPQPAVGAIRRIGSFRQLTERPLAATAYVDEALDLDRPQPTDRQASFHRDFSREEFDPQGKPYPRAVFAYRVRTLDKAGTLGGPSPAVLTIPSSPQQVFSREEAGTCHLKWAANPERGIAGYRVYRMDGRWDKDPISRLTAQPIAGTTFDDAAAGDDTRRYYVIAVDAIGQEGFPSSPVWHLREWRDYYKPFVGAWHQ
jgi:hypothetical protein